ncbi:drebrin-like [Indicator indicator]|uniref:drebrin-like n=1 Tax=Indicator indicator TaxID=1002788 RepID=UPI0023DF9968|nr:drebrin-like [Indicator indicator]
MAAPGLERHRLALLAAREDVGNPRAGTDWAIFAYEKHHDLKLLDSGAGGLDALAKKFSVTSIMYGLCRTQDPGTSGHRIVLIHWVGENVPECQRQACAGHLPAIRAFFREASVVLSAHHAEEVTQERLSQVLAQMAPTTSPPTRKVPPTQDTQELVGTNYRKTNPALEIQRTRRDNFWAQAEREEEQRKAAERRRALEEHRRWERERMEEERREAAERERRLQETERRIEERRKEQAQLEAEERRKEKARWEQQQREHEEATRDRNRHSESIGKAAEAAVLVSQRSQNPRDFFRQRERSGPTSGPSPTSPGPGARPGARRPFLRYQRSLTESAFIFSRPDLPTSPSPGAFRAVPPPSPRRLPPPLPTSPLGTGTPPWSPTSLIGRRTPPCADLGTPPSPARSGHSHVTSPTGTGTAPRATLGTPSSPMGTGTPPSPARVGPLHATNPMGIGTSPSATLGTHSSSMGTGTLQCVTSPIGTETLPSAMGMPPSPATAGPLSATSSTGIGTPPSATLETSHSPMGTGTAPGANLGIPSSPMGIETPLSVTLETPLSPAIAEAPHATSPTGTKPPPCATLGTLPSPTGRAAECVPTMPGVDPLPRSSPPSTGESAFPDSSCEELLPPPSPPQDEEGPPLENLPLPSPPAWSSPGLLMGSDERVLTPPGGTPLPETPPRRPSPPSLPQDRAPPSPGHREPQPDSMGQEPARDDSGHNGIGEHEQESWGDPWERDPSSGQGIEPSDSILLPQPLHKDKPGFALLLARDPPLQLPGGTNPPTEDEDGSPHAV